MKPPLDTVTGLGLTSAAAPGQFLLQTADPSIAGGGNLRQLADGTVFVGAGTVPLAAVSAAIKTPLGSYAVFPGTTELDTAIGVLVTASGGRTITIGNGATGQGGSVTLVGESSTVTTNSSSGFGKGLTITGAQGTAIGAGVVITGDNGFAGGLNSRIQGGQSVVLGASSQQLESSFFAETVIVGYNTVSAAAVFQAVGVGPSIQLNHSNAIVLGGRLNSDFARQFKVGFGAASNFQPFPIYGVFIGGPDTYAGYEGITYRHVNGSGLDNSVGPLQFVAPRGTGNAQGPVAGLTAGIEFYTGAPGPSSSTVQAQTLQLKIHPSDGSAGVANLEVLNVTLFSGGSAGTLANAPHAGDPDGYLPVLVNGVRYAIPLWQF